MPKRFIKVGACFINPWSTAGVTPSNPPRPEWCTVLMHSGESIHVDAGLDAVVEAIESACRAEDELEVVALATAVGYGRE